MRALRACLVQSHEHPAEIRSRRQARQHRRRGTLPRTLKEILRLFTVPEDQAEFEREVGLHRRLVQ